MEDKWNFESERELDLTEEVSDRLHYHAYHLPFKGQYYTENLRTITNWIVSETVRQNLEIELKNSRIRPFVDPKRETEEMLFEKQKAKPKSKKIKKEDVIKLLKEIEDYNPNKIIAGKRPPVRPFATIEGIPVVRYLNWDLIVLYKQEKDNIYIFCKKNGFEPNRLIVKWLAEYLEEQLTDKDKKRVREIRQAIKDAQSEVKEKDRRSDLPDWDLDR